MTRIAVLLFTVLLASPAYSQGPWEKVTISSLVGDTLRPAQRERFRFFPSVNGFEWAVFFLAGDSIVNAEVGFDAVQGIKSDTLIMDCGTLRSLHARISAVDTLSPDSAIVSLKDGTLFSGTILGETATRIIVATDRFGLVKISRSEVERIARQNAGPSGSYISLVKDPNGTRAFLMPTANTIPAGSGYVADYELFFFTAAFGVTDWLMVNAGTLLIPVSLADEVIDYGVKARIYEVPDRFALAGGLQMLTPLSVGESMGIVYGVASFGNRDTKLNIAFGRAFSTLGGSSNVVGISGDARVSSSIKLLAEFWILPDVNWSPLVIGVRFFGSHLAGDLGLLYPLGVSWGSPIGIPVVNIVYNF